MKEGFIRFKSGFIPFRQKPPYAFPPQRIKNQKDFTAGFFLVFFEHFHDRVRKQTIGASESILG